MQRKYKRVAGPIVKETLEVKDEKIRVIQLFSGSRKRYLFMKGLVLRLTPPDSQVFICFVFFVPTNVILLFFLFIRLIGLKYLTSGLRIFDK